jgi:serine/threonine-protein kinase RsbW
MAEKTSETIRVDTFLDSALGSADEAEHLVLGVAREVGFHEDDLHKIGMAVRESIVNAVVHGNRYNRRKRVHLAVSNGGDHLTVVVGDEGEGFDPSKLPDPVAEPNLLQQSGRGIFLIRAFVDDFQIRRLSPSGTEVKFVKYVT